MIFTQWLLVLVSSMMLSFGINAQEGGSGDLRLLAQPVASDSLELPHHTSTESEVSLAENSDGLYVATVELNTPEELKELFDRAEQYLTHHQGYNGSSPIEVVLHGPEVRVFQRKNYDKYKLLVDQAARLDANNIVDVRVCEIWMRADKVNASELPSFVDTVPNGPAYKEQLFDRGYRTFEYEASADAF